MDSSVYIVLSRQMAQFQDMEITSNNVANINTPGFNAQKLNFTSYLVDNGKTGKKDAYADAPSAYRDTSNGALKNTGNTFDLAINGNGYFMVETPLGTRYTRSGGFQVNADSTIVTADGMPVLGNDNSPITIPQGAKNIEINAIGQITADGQSVGQVGLVEFKNEQSLKRLGNSLYSSDETPEPAQTAHMVQGAIEDSNVNGITELVRVMDISRNFGSSAKFIDTVYDLEQKTSSTFTHKATS